MRVIAGSAKGVRLGPVPPGARPVSDRAREGLFSSLGDAVRGARVLDLFAGTGALGIEALSRGATHATFVDRSARACDAIRRNLELTHLGRQAIVHKHDALAMLQRGRTGPRFDLVFCDPPYDVGGREVADVLQELASGWIGGSGWRAVLSRPVESSTPVVPLHWLARRRLRYGDSLLIVYQEDPWA
jgi:16S rRNA (guanine966-N2)-methyltransferase